jgi:hypothetical protein
MPLVAARDLTMYAGAEVEVVRLALNLDQGRSSTYLRTSPRRQTSASQLT